MPIEANRISRVVIRGEWVTVQRGTFRIEPFTVLDDAGGPMHPDLGHWAYHFLTDDGDEYYGPVTDIQLYKMAVTG